MPENFESKPPMPIIPEVRKQSQDEVTLSPEQQEKEAKDILDSDELKQKVVLNLKAMNVGRVVGSLQKRVDLQERVLSDGEVKELIYDRYQWLLARGNGSQAKELETFLRLTPEERLEIDASELVSYLQSKKFNPDTLKNHSVTEAEKTHPEVQAQAAEVAKEYIRKNQFDAALKTEQFFNLPKEIIIDELLTDGKKIRPWDSWEKIEGFKEKFALPDSFIQRVVKGRVMNRYYDLHAITIELERSPDMVALLADEEIISKITEATASKISVGDFGPVEQLLEAINVPNIVKNNIDEIASSKIQKDKLIKFAKYFSGDSEVSATFPKTMERVRTMLLESIETNLDLADYFVENLENYYKESWVEGCVLGAVSHYSVAQKVLQVIDAGNVWTNVPWIEAVKNKAQKTVEENSGHGAEKFKESDPYEHHQWRFGTHQMQISSEIANFLTGTEKSLDKLKSLGFQTKELPSLLSKVNKEINTSYQDFLEQIRSNSNISDEDKESFLNPEKSLVKMTPLIENIRSLVARYIAQLDYKYSLGDNKWLNTKSEDDKDQNYKQIFFSNLQGTLKEGFARYIKIHEVDVPLYDKLYEEFDTLRETGRYPLEVYLGRDGIYAYIGRHAQDVARRRKMGMEGRKKLKEMGEVIEIHPQYIVYPRYFRDNIDYQTKRQFLEQEEISPSADPLFYDTGYTGTIPEQIMRVMDFSEEDIEQRIRLLSAPSAHRRVKGISENARSEIIEYIEHNAKTEETAEGLIIDKKTGKIRHIAKPTTPEEQFYFMMVKQAITRHYWLQEQLHHEPSGNVNLDSEHYTIRIRQEYAKLLPEEFIEDPKQFFTQHGELLKGSKGEGQYPDEEVILFKLSDGTEIVAKRIELRKAKEARKEFSILIFAKKAGLPTAEPVGFLSGKEDQDGSYLLMKKIEGRSGRKFEKELRESGKYSDDQIKNIMQQVAEKNKEMAELFRTTLKIDKRWRIKDTIIEFNEETGDVGSVVPIDWERVQNYNPATPKEIDEIT